MLHGYLRGETLQCHDINCEIQGQLNLTGYFGGMGRTVVAVTCCYCQNTHNKGKHSAS